MIEPGNPEFAELTPLFPDHPGARSIIRIDCQRISDSCGFGVPLMAFEGDRSTLDKYSERKGPEGLEEYKRAKNAASLDGLPGLNFD